MDVINVAGDVADIISIMRRINYRIVLQNRDGSNRAMRAAIMSFHHANGFLVESNGS